MNIKKWLDGQRKKAWDDWDKKSRAERELWHFKSYTITTTLAGAGIGIVLPGLVVSIATGDFLLTLICLAAIALNGLMLRSHYKQRAEATDLTSKLLDSLLSFYEDVKKATEEADNKTKKKGAKKDGKSQTV